MWQLIHVKAQDSSTLAALDGFLSVQRIAVSSRLDCPLCSKLLYVSTLVFLAKILPHLRSYGTAFRRLKYISFAETEKAAS